MADEEPIDVVYTWVDDNFAGYRELLERHTATAHDRNPNRTRDNLDILKYSLRSLERFVPWMRNVYLVTLRPQLPSWLAREAPGLRIVHHDTFLESAALPTFNSFTILSSLPRIAGLSRRFLYVEDDMLFAAETALSDFADETGRLRLYPRLGFTAPAKESARADLSPWNASLAHSNHLLDQAFGKTRRHGVNHLPLLIDREWWGQMEERWPEDFARTRASRFRARHNVAPEYLYPYFLLYTQRGRLEPMWRTYRNMLYGALENFPPLLWWTRARVVLLKPKTIALNDGFGERPNPAVVAGAHAFLERTWPIKSRFET